MSNTYQGGCRCGAVRYSAAGTALDVRICHCRDCQYASGSAFSAIAYFPKEAVTSSGETRGYAVKGSAGLTVDRHFCPHCGTPVFSQLLEMPGLIFIKLGTLDDPGAIAPKGHMWCDSMVSWLHFDDGLECVPGNPPL